MAVSELAGIWLNIHGAYLHICSNDLGIIDRVREGYAFFEMTPEDTTECDQWFHLLALSGDADDYARLAGRALDTDSLPPYCLLALDYGKVYCIATYDVLNYLTGIFFTAEMVARLHEDFMVFHGSGVEADGKGVIFPAALRSGKTTLALSFVYQGFRMSSDDVLLLHRESLRIYPYPRLFGLRQESLYLVPGVHRDYPRMTPSNLFGEMRWFLDKSDAVAEPFVCKCVAFPQLRQDVTRLEPMSKAEAALALIKHAFHPTTPTVPEANVELNLGTLSRFLESAECYTLYHWDPRESLALLADHVWGKKLRLA